jgi:hypothetical protein
MDVEQDILKISPEFPNLLRLAGVFFVAMIVPRCQSADRFSTAIVTSSLQRTLQPNALILAWAGSANEQGKRRQSLISGTAPCA